MNDFRELTSDEVGAVSGGLGLLGEIKDILSGSESQEKHEHEHGLIEKIEHLLGLS